MFDYLVVGAGFAGSVIAERLAEDWGKKVLVVDRRPHIGGNAYDCHDQHDILIHKYGPHIFHTNSRDVFDYLGRFTEWRPYQHRVLASVDGQLLPIPINLDTINSLYGTQLTSAEAEAFLASLAEHRHPVRTSEDVVVNKVGRELYEKFFRGYTRKQWGLDPSELHSSVTARIPVRTNRDARYFTDTYQAMPLRGYTHLFERMLSHRNIKVMLNTDYREIAGVVPYQELIYSGPIDEFFDFRLGKLPYRSLQFQHETLPLEQFQPVGTVNYPNDYAYTRISEFKHLTGQRHPYTSIVYEFPCSEGDPYYPVPKAENDELYTRYKGLADATSGVHFVGRLATYKYYNMDQVVAQALALYKRLRQGAPAERTNVETASAVAASRMENTNVDERVPSADERRKLNLWGGIECTVNRVGDTYFDQLEFSGHRQRIDDLELVAELGIQVLRYPVLWETTELRSGELDFSWCDPRIRKLGELGIEPIVGLLHHGAGPRHTSLLDPEFPSKFAKYARRIAERYPYLHFFTPINEPLTTARFSGLYGHWYPHGRDDRIFVRALLNECEGIRLAMRAIREVIPDAELVQTDDMGYTRSTESLRYQADFDNERRWLSFDLLSGRVDRQHPLYTYLLAAGASVSELARFQASPCVPDVLGLNYYVTSERFLDDRLGLYAPERIGGNGRHVYADVEAVRVCADGLIGPSTLLRDAHARYGAPVALTEAHLGGPGDERVRWLKFLWTSASAAREAGADVRAVTVWALFGAYGWDQLVTRGPVSYEAGVFDMSGGLPRETELTGFVRELASGSSAHCEDTPGWWELPTRIVYEPHGSRAA